MMQHEYREFVIEIVDDPTFKYGSSDNYFDYSGCYFGQNGKEFPVSKHGIKIRDGKGIVNSCILVASGGATGIHTTSSIIDDDHLLVCCCDTVFCLSIPSLLLEWQVKADQATCFQIVKVQDDYLVHGELQITRLSKNGKVQWEFGGRGIFVSITGEKEFEVFDENIILTDFGGTKYRLGFDGKLLQERMD